MKRDLAKVGERLEKCLGELNDADSRDGEPPSGGGTTEKLAEKIASMKERREKLAGYQKTLEESGEDQLSLTDPDARALERNTRVGVGYNIQIAVDAKHKLIAERQVHAKVSDLGLLAQTVSAARASLDIDAIDVVADKGCFAIEDIEACEAGGATPFVPKPRRGAAATKGLFVKERFRYDSEADCCICPGGQSLPPVGKKHFVREGVFERKCRNFRACKTCPLKARCTTSEARTVTRYENEAVLERMAARLAARPDILNDRRETVEHPFGSIKQWMGQGAFLMRRLDNVRAEFSLTALACNIRRATNLIGIPALIEAARA